MNAFTEYALEAIPPAVQRRQSRQEAKPESALDKKMAEKQRLTRAYKLWQRKVREDTLLEEPRLRDFMRYLRTVQPEQADELLEQVRGSWLMDASQAVRIFALRLIARHSDRLNRRAGNEALDDPMPPETSVYFEAREMLHAGGRA